MEVNFNDTEVNAKKDLDKVKDKIEIERLVNELVSWVAEENDISAKEKLINESQKVKYAAEEADKKADDALLSIKELEEKREKELEEKRERKEKKEKDKNEKDEKDKEENEVCTSTPPPLYTHLYSILLFVKSGLS